MEVFEAVVELDDEVTHEGGEGDFLGFPAGEQVLVDALEARVAPAGDQGGHVEFTSQQGAPSTDETFAFVTAAVARIGGDTCQGGSGGAVQTAQLGHFGQERMGHGRPHPGFGQELVAFEAQGLGGIDELIDECFDVLDLPIELPQQFALALEQDLERQATRLVGEALAGVQELIAAPGELAQVTLLSQGAIHGSGVGLGSETGQHVGVDGVGFGPLAQAADEVPHPGGIDNTQEPALVEEEFNQGLFEAPGGFAHQMERRLEGLEQALQALEARGGIGQRAGQLGVDVELEGVFGDIDSDVDRGRVHAHPCNASRSERTAQSTVRVMDRGVGRSGYLRYQQQLYPGPRRSSPPVRGSTAELPRTSSIPQRIKTRPRYKGCAARGLGLAIAVLNAPQSKMLSRSDEVSCSDG